VNRHRLDFTRQRQVSVLGPGLVQVVSVAFVVISVVGIIGVELMADVRRIAVCMCVSVSLSVRVCISCLAMPYLAVPILPVVVQRQRRAISSVLTEND
jgi:hypothetical protein